MSVKTSRPMERSWFGLGPLRPSRVWTDLEITCDGCGYKECGGIGVWTGLSLSPRWMIRHLPGGRSEVFCCNACRNKQTVSTPENKEAV